MSLAHEPLGKPGGPGLFHHKGMQLPAFIQHIARDLMTERGMPESEAIATAIAQCKRWAAGGQDVKPETRAKAAAAIAEWERLRARAHATRSTPMSSGYDEDGLDGSWDDLDGLPDLAGLGVADFEAAAGPADGGVSRSAKLGTGARFKALKAKLAAKGASDPGALAAYIGRKRYGKAKFTAMAAKARSHKGGGMHRTELLRTYPLEDIHILTRAEGDGSGRVVEAYATVFDTEAEIRDHQGHYKEIIDRSAFDQVLGRIMRSPGGLAAQVKVLFNHGRTMGGVEAPEFQLPLGKPLDVRPEQRGLLTRTEYDASDPFTERVLSKIHAGTITAQSFVGGIIRSSPELSGPGAKYRGRNGVLPTVRRMVLGLREYGPVLYPAYTGAEILGVRMSIPGGVLDGETDEGAPDSTGDEEYVPAMDMEDDGAGGTPEEVHPSRDHAHRLLVMRTEQMCREAGIAPLKGWAS
jgi:phage head maturation protease